MDTKTNLEVIVAEPRIVELATKEFKLSTASAQEIGVQFKPFFDQFAELKRAAEAVGSNAQLAGVLRLQVKKLRIAADKARESLKRGALLFGRACDGANNLLLVDLEPVEAKLEAVEKAEEIRREAERKRILAERQSALEIAHPGSSAAYGDSLAAMEQAAFDQLLAGVKAARLAALEAERVAKEAEEKRKAEEAAEKERLRKEAEELREKMRQDQLKRDAEAAAAKAESDKILKAEAAKLAKVKAEADHLRAEAAKEKAEKDAAEKAEQERQHKLAVGQDWEKMRAWIAMFASTLEAKPAFSTGIAKEMAAGIHDAIERAAEYAKGEGEE